MILEAASAGGAPATFLPSFVFVFFRLSRERKREPGGKSKVREKERAEEDPPGNETKKKRHPHPPTPTHHLSSRLTSRDRGLAPHDLYPHVVRRRRVLPGADLVPPPPVARDALGRPAHPSHRSDAAVGDGRGGEVPGHRVEAEAELAPQAVPGGGGSLVAAFGFAAARQHELPEGLGRELLRWRGRRRRRGRRARVGVDEARRGGLLRH